MRTKQLIKALELAPEIEREILTGISTRGKHKDYLLQHGNSDGWRALHLNVAPGTTSIWSITPRVLELNDALEKACEKKFGKRSFLPVILSAFEPDFRWSMSAHDNNHDAIRAAIIASLETR